MNFESALSLMRKGYKVRQKNGKTFFYLDGGKIKNIFIRDTKLYDLDIEFINCDTIMSDDWEIYDEDINEKDINII